jgi:hypothetical protein
VGRHAGYRVESWGERAVLYLLNRNDCAQHRRGKYQWVSTSDSDLVRVCVSAFFIRVYQVVVVAEGARSPGGELT